MDVRHSWHFTGETSQAALLIDLLRYTFVPHPGRMQLCEVETPVSRDAREWCEASQCR